MLSAQENDLVTRCGPDTPMGNLFRQYWLPALQSDELPFNDCPPVRIRILNEDLVAFRTTSGRVGLLEWGCPHRSADFFFGRNEEEGIRCTYHGWKFDINGACVDMPSEPPESTFKERVTAKAYPCVERAGAVWVYMGPRKIPPPMPELEGTMRPDATLMRAGLQETNWLQCMEDNIDTVHLSFLHYGTVPVEAGEDPDWIKEIGAADPEVLKYALRERAPRYFIQETDVGVSYTGYRDAEPETYYHRTAHYMMPCITSGPNSKLGTRAYGSITVPVDDEHCMAWNFGAPTGPIRETRGGRPAVDNTVNPPDEKLPNTNHPLGRFRFKLDMSNDFGIDREVQRSDRRTHKGWTGMSSIGLQDRAIAISQGAIQDRTKEHLGTSDQMVIRTRKLLLDAAMALQEKGEVPPGVDNPEAYRKRSGWVILPRNVDWWEASRTLRETFEIPEEIAPLNVIA